MCARVVDEKIVGATSSVVWLVMAVKRSARISRNIKLQTIGFSVAKQVVVLSMPHFEQEHPGRQAATYGICQDKR